MKATTVLSSEEEQTQTSSVFGTHTVSKLRFHPWNLWAPPAFSRIFMPGRRLRWYVLLRIRVMPSASTCCAVRPLIAAWVATGMKAGSTVTPSKVQRQYFFAKADIYQRGSFILEALARVIGHFASTSNSIAAAIPSAGHNSRVLPFCLCENQGSWVSMRIGRGSRS